MQKSSEESKAPFVAMTDERKREVVAQLTDDVLSKLTGAFFDVCKFERWTKRDLSSISGINETAIGHILAGRRKNLTVETIALLARAMGARPELVLHDTRPTGNHVSPVRKEGAAALSLAAKPAVQRGARALSSAFGRSQSVFRTSSDVQKEGASAEGFAYAQPDLEKEAP
ncbi:helix-turn-helix transcriptional regulator [Bradyrhizobium sp. Ash2021]|uniref:helix-turn-helix domain-containing protein n=1 Tax=Bradyrhizobium sp. Ash2021 TaxID=2954771 RepID=UPI00281602DC|nr:helix-turn-helix transcriptional regulator [Bradyrhizobium sp. Ash2021]WMT79462.1 helix-turn-helix transcriptional regulator [Bradyrhizobium sp. Ash2021]